MTQWYSNIQAILHGEPETWIAYLYGQQLENMPHLTRSKPRLRGAIPRLALFFLFLLRHHQLRQPECVRRRTRCLVFASTINQINAIEGAVNFLRSSDCPVVQIGHIKHSGFSAPGLQSVPFSFTMTDLCKILVLLVSNAAALRRQLKKAHPLATSWYLDKFFGVYAYLVYFYRVLRCVQPELVIVSNDLNPANRALLAAAHYLGVKTVYLQHASISSLFPSLRVNYAFLDGQCAWDIYQKCEPNKPTTARRAPLPTIYLTGQQKRLRKSVDKAGRVGIALNALDSVEAVARATRALVHARKLVIVRWHPESTSRQVDVLRSAFTGQDQLQWSNPKQQGVGDFLAGVSCLIAGNSSIHLEAILAGVASIYYEFSPAENPDYYGYVKNGLVKSATSMDEVLAFTSEAKRKDHPDSETVRYYSATYDTEWEGREAELLGTQLLALVQGGKAINAQPS